MKYQILTTGTSEPVNALENPAIRSLFLRAIESDQDLKNYLDDDLQEEVESFKAVKLNEDGTLIWEIKTKKSLAKVEEKKLLDFLTGQCSDGWGEGFEQHPILNQGEVEYYYSPWKRGSKATIVNKSEN